LAKNYASQYVCDCLAALKLFEDTKCKNKDQLIAQLDSARNGYVQSVLGRDRSCVSMAVRYLLMAVVNFIAGLTCGVLHYRHYNQSGVVGFFSETNSERQLRTAHQELTQEIKHSFSSVPG
jgi:hypothetical protein